MEPRPDQFRQLARLRAALLLRPADVQREPRRRRPAVDDRPVYDAAGGQNPRPAAIVQKVEDPVYAVASRIQASGEFLSKSSTSSETPSTHSIDLQGAGSVESVGPGDRVHVEPS